MRDKRAALERSAQGEHVLLLAGAGTGKTTTLARRLRQLPGRSVFNLHVCTSQLHLISTLLARLHPSAAAPSAAVREELVELTLAPPNLRCDPQQRRALARLALEPHARLLELALVPVTWGGGNT